MELTRALTAAGMHVIVPARRTGIAREALHGIAGVEIAPLDLADLASIHGFADHLIESGRTLDLVIGNAGIMACPEERVGPGWESQFAVNHLGHFALVNRLAPAFSPDGARVVSVSSGAHALTGIRWDDIHFSQEPYDRWLAYGQSKTANVLFALQLSTWGRDRGIRAYSLHPGAILTPLQRHVPRAEQIALGWINEDGRAPAGFKTPPQGAATAAWAATAPVLGSHAGVYCEDCDIAPVADTDNMLDGGVKPWAIDPGEAERLWHHSAEATGADAFR